MQEEVTNKTVALVAKKYHVDFALKKECAKHKLPEKGRPERNTPERCKL